METAEKRADIEAVENTAGMQCANGVCSIDNSFLLALKMKAAQTDKKTDSSSVELQAI